MRTLLGRIDGRPYPAYRDLRGSWALPGGLELVVDHVQGDPFASPSKVRLRVPLDLAHTGIDRRAAEDWLLRRFGDRLTSRSRGSGRSGALGIYRPGPEITERTAARLGPRGVELRMTVGLPARGRRILGRQAWELLCEDLPDAARALDDLTGLDAHLESVRDQQALRDQLAERGLVAFVADGSVLPRRSGIDQRPLAEAVPFEAPETMAVTLTTPHAGEVRGWGVRAGVTLITGGGFHGKSTVLAALQRGHLDHVPGDGRERVVALPSVVKVRAEDGRRIEKVDISAFLGELPGGRSTAPFSTEDASGSTSQAAALVEAIEAGAGLVLLDEDTSATNLLVRDERMRALIPREREPITPLVERVRQLHAEWGVSTVMVVGGVGDFLAVADTVLGMADYQAQDWTERARALAGPAPTSPGPLPRPSPRAVLARGLEPGKIRAWDERRLRYGDTELELGAVEQVLDAAHAGTLGQALRFLHDELVDDQRTLPQLLDALDAILRDEGLEVLSPRDHPDGRLLFPRRQEVAAALDRLRTLGIR